MKLSYQLHGGQLLQASCLGQDLLYVSKIRASSESVVRGGVPIIFPQFADRGTFTRHGWARHLRWELDAEVIAPHSIYRSVSLEVAAGVIHDWPYAVRLILDTKLELDVLEVVLKVINLGNANFSWTGGLHPYWATQDILGSELLGLMGSKVEDRFKPERTLESSEFLRWSGDPCESLYEAKGALDLRTPSHDLRLEVQGFTHWMIWNPGKTGERLVSDLEPNDWRRFVCIEPLAVSPPILLSLGESFEGHLRARIVRQG
jgi:glucose-6-phosphate 1-epimerase